MNSTYGHDELEPYEDLCDRIVAGEKPEYLLFYGHVSNGPRLGPECFSQWFPAPFVVNGVTYPTAEHYMMTAKADLFGDLETKARILTASSPKEAKDLGRIVRDFDQDAWTQHRFGIVVKGNHAKFAQNQALGEYLVSTDPKVLVEASPYDKVWGVGLDKNDIRIPFPRHWEGPNLLGFALMKVRSFLRLPKWATQ